jgi:hypothetical protein
MRPRSLLAVSTVALLGTQAALPPSGRAQARDPVQWRVTTARYCQKADSVFGTLWRSHPSSVRVGYSRNRDTVILHTPVRATSWEAGGSRLVNTEAVIRAAGSLPMADSARIELSLSFLDSLFRSPEQARFDILLDDSVRLELPDPAVDYPLGRTARGVPLVVTVLLTAEQSLTLARAHNLRGTMGPFPFFLYGWEVWDINALYRASFCGIR